MPRAPFQVLVLPFSRTATSACLYAVFRRSDGDYWQFIAGGGEEDESPVEAARREACEEAGIPHDAPLIALDSSATIPVPGVTGGPMRWGDAILVVPEHCFAVEVERSDMVLSAEHKDWRWSTYDEAQSLLKWDSNKNALWELRYRLDTGGL